MTVSTSGGNSSHVSNDNLCSIKWNTANTYRLKPLAVSNVDIGSLRLPEFDAQGVKWSRGGACRPSATMQEILINLRCCFCCNQSDSQSINQTMLEPVRQVMKCKLTQTKLFREISPIFFKLPPPYTLAACHPIITYPNNTMRWYKLLNYFAHCQAHSYFYQFVFFSRYFHPDLLQCSNWLFNAFATNWQASRTK